MQNQSADTRSNSSHYCLVLSSQCSSWPGRCTSGEIRDLPLPLRVPCLAACQEQANTGTASTSGWVFWTKERSQYTYESCQCREWEEDMPRYGDQVATLLMLFCSWPNANMSCGPHQLATFRTLIRPDYLPRMSATMSTDLDFTQTDRQTDTYMYVIERADNCFLSIRDTGIMTTYTQVQLGSLHTHLFWFRTAFWMLHPMRWLWLHPIQDKQLSIAQLATPTCEGRSIRIYCINPRCGPTPTQGRAYHDQYSPLAEAMPSNSSASAGPCTCLSRG